MLMIRPTLLGLCLLCAACGAQQAAVSPTPRDPTAALRLEPQTPLTPPQPPWFAQAHSQAVAYPADLGQARVLALGRALSLHQTRQGVFAVDQSKGVLGRLNLPTDRFIWAGLDGQDNVWLSEKSGQMWTQDVRSTQAGRFVKKHNIPDAKSWDVAGSIVAVATPTAVHESQDYGNTWRIQPLPKAFSISQVYTRSDGVVALYGLQDGARTTYLKSKKETAWRLATYQPKNLGRYGSWLWNGDPTCIAVLADDARTWSATPDLSVLPGYQDVRNGWLNMTFEETASPQGTLLNSLTSAPPVPPKSMRHEGTTERCQDPIPDAASLRRNAPKPRQDLKTPCQGTACLFRTTRASMPISATFYAILADHTPTRAASLVRVEMDRGALDVHRPPVGCLPKRVFNAQGMGVLLCEHTTPDNTTVYTRAPDGPWTKEHAFKGRAHGITDASIAQDGTLLLRGQCDDAGSCQDSHIRRPMAPAKERWYTVAGVAMVTPAIGGRVLIGQVLPSRPEHLTLSITDGRRIRALTQINAIDKPVQDIRLRQGVVELLMGDGFKSTAIGVRADGALIQK